MSNSDNGRIHRLEVKNEDHERRIRIQEEKNEQLNEIATYTRLQYEHNKNQDIKIDKIGAQFEQVTTVLDGINTSLLSLNHDVKYVKDRQNNADDRLEDLEKERIKELELFKKDRRESALKIITGVIVTVLGAAVLTYLNLK